MICGKCGNVCGDTEVFCGNCGNRLAPAPEEVRAAAQQAEQVQAQAQQAEQVQAQAQQAAGQYQAPAGQQWQQYAAPAGQAPNGFYAAGAQAPVEKKKKSGKKAVIITVAIIALLALVAAAIFLIPKLFKSDEGNFKDIERAELSDAAGGVSTLYSELIPNDAPLTTEFKISVDKSLLSMISQDVDVSWLSDIGLTIDRVGGDDATAGTVTVSLGGTDVLTAEVKYDKADDLLYVRIPELSDKYISFNSSLIQGLGLFNSYSPNRYGFNSYDGGDAEFRGVADLGLDLDLDNLDPQQLLPIVGALSSALPDSETTSELIERYGEVVIDSVKEVTKGTDTLEVEGVSQECTSYTVHFNEDQIKTTVKAVLEKVKTDDDIKEIVERAVNVVSEYSDDFRENTDADDVYDEFIKSIDEAIEELDSSERATSDESLIDYTVFTAGDKVVGRDVVVRPEGDFEALNYSSRFVGDNDDFAFEVKCDVGTSGNSVANATYSGKGTGALDGYTGSGLLKATVDGEELELVKTEYKDFSFEDVKKGELNGNVTVSICSDLADMLEDRFGGDYSTAMVFSALQQMKIDLNFDHSGPMQDFDASLTVLGQKFLNIECHSENKAKTVDTRIPDSSDAVKVENSSDLEEWVKDWDVSSFVKGLKKAGVPSEICDLITEGIGQSFGNGGYDDWDSDDWDTDDWDTDDWDTDDWDTDDWDTDDWDTDDWDTDTDETRG